MIDSISNSGGTEEVKDVSRASSFWPGRGQFKTFESSSGAVKRVKIKLKRIWDEVREKE